MITRRLRFTYAPLQYDNEGSALAHAVVKQCRTPLFINGFTVIEIMVVLLIFGSMMVVVTAGIGRAFRASDINYEVDNIVSLATAIKSLAANGGLPPQIVPLLRSANAIPGGMVDSGGDTLINAWSGQVSISATASGFDITYGAVPQAACVQLATRLARNGDTAVRVGGDPIDTAAGALTSVTAQATGLCTSASPNQLTFVYQ